MTCAAFIDTIGVNTHVAYADGQYRAVRAIQAAMDHIGLKYARDGAINPLMPSAGHYRALGAGGISFCMFWGVHRTMAEAIGHISGLEAAYPGSVHALEGPNEIKPGFAWQGLTGNAAGQAFMSALRAAAAADPRLRHKPVVNFTSYAPAAADCDFANQHPYPKGGHQPAPTLLRARDEYVGPFGPMPGKPMMFTEFGYHTLIGKPAKPWHWQGVDEARQAILIVNGLLAAAASGIGRTYIYQLLDGYPEGRGQPDQERHFGLFRVNGSPKPAADAIRTLISVLSDHTPAREAPAPRETISMSTIAIKGAGKALYLRGFQGREFVALWNESEIWDPLAFAPKEAEPAIVTVSGGQPRALRAIDLLDPAGSQDFPAAPLTRIRLGAHPVVLRLA
jgi:hypothetical protein